MVKAVINSSGGVTAKINSNTSSGPEQVSVTLPSSAAAQSLVNLSDVDVSDLADGSLLQYNSSTSKFEAKNTLGTTAGNITFTAGTF